MSERRQTPRPPASGADRARGFDHRITPRSGEDARDDERSERDEASLRGIPEALRPWALLRRSGRRAPTGTPTDDAGGPVSDRGTGSVSEAGSVPDAGTRTDPPTTPTSAGPDRSARAAPERAPSGGDPVGGGPSVGDGLAVRDVDARELVAAALSKVTRHSVIVLDRGLRVRAAAGHGHDAPPYDEPSMRGRLLRDVLHPEQWSLYGPLLATAVDGATSRRFITSRLGVGRAEVTFGPVVAEGAITGAIMVTRELDPTPDDDQAELRSADAARAEAGRAEIASVFALTFEHSPIAQALLTPDGCWVRANRATCRMLGVREADLVGRPIREILSSGEREVAQGWTDRLRSGELDEFALPTRFLRRTGGTIDASVRLAAARNADGELQGLVAQLVDLGV